jgi:hypothetical protein
MARFSGDPPLCHYASKWSTSLESLACVAHDPQPVNSRIQNASHLRPVAAMASAWKFVDVMRWPGWDQHWDGMKNQHNIIRFIVDLPIENASVFCMFTKRASNHQHLWSLWWNPKTPRIFCGSQDGPIWLISPWLGEEVCWMALSWISKSFGWVHTGSNLSSLHWLLSFWLLLIFSYFSYDIWNSLWWCIGLLSGLHSLALKGMFYMTITIACTLFIY